METKWFFSSCSLATAESSTKQKADHNVSESMAIFEICFVLSSMSNTLLEVVFQIKGNYSNTCVIRSVESDSYTHSLNHSSNQYNQQNSSSNSHSSQIIAYPIHSTSQPSHSTSQICQSLHTNDNLSHSSNQLNS